MAWDKAIYPASVVDNAISACNLELQITGQPPSVMTNPVRDLTQIDSS